MSALRDRTQQLDRETDGEVWPFFHARRDNLAFLHEVGVDGLFAFRLRAECASRMEVLKACGSDRYLSDGDSGW